MPSQIVIPADCGARVNRFIESFTHIPDCRCADRAGPGRRARLAHHGRGV